MSEPGKTEFVPGWNADPSWARGMCNKIVEQNWAILRMNADLLKVLHWPMELQEPERRGGSGG